jgi:hypothetical protein
MVKKYILILFIFLVLGCQNSSDENLIDVIIENPAINSGKNPEEESSSTKKSFDREEMLKFIVNQIIIPSFNNLETNLAELKTSFDLFNGALTEENLTDLRNKWLEAYKAWQYVEMFNIGKAMEDYYLYKSNIYPVDTSRVNANIDSGAYDLENPNNYSAQGFPTIDYLLYGLDNDPSKVINHLRDNSKKRDYLGVIIGTLFDNTKAIKENWNAVKDEFVKSTENTASSNLNMMVNDFIYYYEKGFRANKFGIPGGVFSSGALPDKVEGYYSKVFTKELALVAMTSIKNFFNGISFENNEVKGQCLKSYLDYIESSKEKLLSDEINAQLDIAERSINELDNSLVNQINSDLTTVLRTYDDIQATVVLLKVDMLQILNINVDFADADGD